MKPVFISKHASWLSRLDSRFLLISSCLFIFLSCLTATAQKKSTPKVPAKVPTKQASAPAPVTRNFSQPLTRILFVFDASYSMFGQWQSGMKMDLSKKILSEFLDSINGTPNLELAFRPYGHQVPLRPERSCTDTKLEVPFGGNNIQAIKNKLKVIVPKGTTPIAYTLEQAAGDFPTPSSKSVRNIIILITDGIEECDGDPCAISLALQKKGVVLKPFVIGIGLDQSYMNTFGCIGKFYDASSEANFK